MALIPRAPGSSGVPGGGIPRAPAGMRPSDFLRQSASSRRRITEGVNRRGLPPSRGPDFRSYLESGSMEDVATEYETIQAARMAAGIERPITPLTLISAAFSVPQNAVMGFFKGYSQYEGIQDPSESIWEPWEYLKAIGAGFREVPHAVRDVDYTQDLLHKQFKEEGRLGNFGERHSTALALSAAVITDPLMYASFGTTTASRLAAAGHLEASLSASSAKAVKIWEKTPGRFDGQRFNDVSELQAYVHAKEGRPQSLADALDDLRDESTAIKALARRGRPVKVERRVLESGAEEMEVVPRTGVGRLTGTLGGYLNPAAQGGRGIRMAGVPIPGTPEMGAYLGMKARATGGVMKDNIAYQALLKGVPKAALRHIAGDQVRTSALLKFRRFEDKMGSVSASPVRVAQQLLKGELVETTPAKVRRLGRGDPEAVPIYTLEKARAANHAGPGLYVSTSKKVQKMFAAKDKIRRMEDFETPDPGPAAKITQIRFPKRMLDEVFDASRPLDKHADAGTMDFKVELAFQQAMRDTMANIKGFRAEDATFEQLVSRISETGQGKSLIELFQIAKAFFSRMTGEVADEPAHAKLLREFHQSFQARMKELGFKGLKYPAADAYPGITGIKKTDYDYTFWDEVEFNQLAANAHPEQQAERVVLGSATSVGSEARKNLHVKAMKEVSDPKLKAMKKRIELVKGNLKQRSAKEGMSEGEFDRQWRYFADNYEDPIDAMALFSSRIEGRILASRFTRDILDDPLFAYPLAQNNVLKPGYVQRSWRGQEYAVKYEIDEAIDSFTNPAVLDREVSRYLKLLNWPQDKWKIIATVPNMSFHTMNAIGALWNNMLGGLTNPADYVSAVATIARSRMGHRREEGKGLLRGTEVREPTQKQRQAMVTTQRAEDLGGLGRSSYIMAEMERGVARDIQESLKPPGVERLVKPGPGLTKKRFAARRGRQGIAAALAITGNPLAVIPAAPDIIAAGRYVAGTIEDVVRVAPFMKGANNPALARVLEAYGPVRVPGFKGPRGLSRAQQETMYETGAALSRTFQFDYTELTNFERKVAKTIFPFYTYYKKNMTRQAIETVKQPRNLQAWNHIMEENEDQPWALPPQFAGVLPYYFDQLEAFAVPMDKETRSTLGLPSDQPLYLNPKLPFISLNLFPPLWTVFQDTGQPTPQKLLSAIAPQLGMVGPLAPVPVPGAKFAFEAALNWQFGLARPIDFQRAQSNDWRQSYRDAPGWVKFLPKPLRDWSGIFHETETGRILMTSTSAYILGQMSTPFIDNLGNAIPPTASGEIGEQKARADLVSWMTGVRLMPVDLMKLHRSSGYQMIAVLEAEKQEKSEIGQRLDAEDEVLLRRLRRQMRILERVYDVREQELNR